MSYLNKNGKKITKNNISFRKKTIRDFLSHHDHKIANIVGYSETNKTQLNVLDVKPKIDALVFIYRLVTLSSNKDDLYISCSFGNRICL